MKLTKDVLLKYAADLKQRISYVEEFTRDGQEASMNDPMIIEASIRSYEVIGEIIKRLPVSIHADALWHKTKVFCEYLIDNFEHVSFVYLWDAVLDLPNLKAAVLAMQKSLTDEE